MGYNEQFRYPLTASQSMSLSQHASEQRKQRGQLWCKSFQYTNPALSWKRYCSRRGWRTWDRASRIRNTMNNCTPWICRACFTTPPTRAWQNAASRESGSIITFWMNRRFVERIVGFKNSQKANGLFKSFRSHLGNAFD